MSNYYNVPAFVSKVGTALAERFYSVLSLRRGLSQESASLKW